MANYKIAKMVRHRNHFTCEMCGKHKLSKMYEYQSISYVRDYIPHHYKEMCGDCIYREVYGTKTCRKMKKEKTLDGGERC